VLLVVMMHGFVMVMHGFVIVMMVMHLVVMVMLWFVMVMLGFVVTIYEVKVNPVQVVSDAVKVISDFIAFSSFLSQWVLIEMTIVGVMMEMLRSWQLVVITATDRWHDCSYNGYEQNEPEGEVAES
jgi:hypothetical protein